MGSIAVAQHFQLLLKSMKAKRCLEIGCMMGYTALTMAMALPDNGEVVSLDIEDADDDAKKIWRESGQNHKVNFCFV